MELLKSSRAARKQGAEGPALVIHAEREWLGALLEEKFDFFTKLAMKARAEGMSTLVVPGGGRAAARLMEDPAHVHLILGDRPLYGPRILHAIPSYVWGFWYLDELGVFWNSSLRFARFCPEEVDIARAEYFFNGVTGYMLRENVSKIPQEERVHGPLRGAGAVIFCQEIEHEDPRAHYLTTEEMIRTTAETLKEARVYVKLHPNQSKPARQAIMAICQDYPNLKMSEASVHDLIEASDVVVTQNSGAGFEAFMQKAPVITCAKSDYWHATLTARNARDLAEALRYGAEAMADFPYEKYFYWFLGRGCLEPAKDNFANRAWGRIREKAFL